MPKNKQGTAGYTPKYAKDEILVAFKKNVSESFAREFGAHIGYNLISTWEYGTNLFIYSVPAGAHDTAKIRFKEQKDFVDAVMDRDLKLEYRWKSLEEATAMLSSLYDNCEIPDREYSQKLRELAKYLNRLQK